MPKCINGCGEEAPEGFSTCSSDCALKSMRPTSNSVPALGLASVDFFEEPQATLIRLKKRIDELEGESK